MKLGLENSFYTFTLKIDFGESSRACGEGFETLGGKFSFEVETIPS